MYEKIFKMIYYTIIYLERLDSLAPHLLLSPTVYFGLSFTGGKLHRYTTNQLITTKCISQFSYFKLHRDILRLLIFYCGSSIWKTKFNFTVRFVIHEPPLWFYERIDFI